MRWHTRVFWWSVRLIWWAVLRVWYEVSPCNTLNHTATHCNTLERTSTRCNTQRRTLWVWMSRTGLFQQGASHICTTTKSECREACRCVNWNRREWMCCGSVLSFWGCVFTCAWVGVVDAVAMYIWMSQVTWMSSCHRQMSHVSHERVMSHKNGSRHTWMRHVTYEWVMSRMNESCHVWMRHVIYE